MTHLFVLWLALFAAQATTPVTPPPSEPPTAQPAQPPASVTPTTPTPDQAAPANPPSPNPDVSVIHQVGGGVTPPKVLSMPEPQFSQLARKQKVSGVATVQLIVDAQGNPANVHITKSIADTVGKNKKKQAAALSLDQAALDAVKQYKFAPATLHGKPVAVYMNVEVNFQLL
jgi:protein TonB